MKKRWRYLTGLLCAVMLLLGGCGSGADTAADGEEAFGTGEMAVSMGSYMETFYELPENLGRNGGVNWLSDGTLSVIGFNSGLWISGDGGQSWQQEEAEWFPLIQGVYCLDAVMRPDGSVAATCSGVMSEAVRAVCEKPPAEDWEGNYCIFVSTDGAVKAVNFGFTQEDGTCISSFVCKEDGRLFAGDMNGRVCEVDTEHESLTELFTAEREVGYMDFAGNLLLAVGHDRLYQYDLEQSMLLSQDMVADAFVKQVLADGTVSFTGGGYPLVVTGGEDEDTIYLACEDGMYRHALGGSMMEQIIDGALSTLGDSTATIYGMKYMGDQEFLMQFNPSEGLVRYRYDENVPSMPDREIRIYSLEENAGIRQAATAYRKAHADIYVRYEVGMETSAGMTREDALKRLNTQILSGEGPDVLILDGLPLDTWIEKGLLRDMSSVLDSMDGENALFPNLIDAFRTGSGAVYAMPMCIRIPLAAGDRAVIADISDGENMASAVETLRREFPQGGILGIYDAKALLQLFGMTESLSWINDAGQIDEAAVGDYLSRMKRIYESELSGVSKAALAQAEEEDELFTRYGENAAAKKQEICYNVLNLPVGKAMLACGYADGIQLCLNNVTSVLRTDENLDYTLFQSQGKAVFLPVSLAGISAASEHPEDAEEFVRIMFSPESQERMYEGFPVNRTAFDRQYGWMEPDSDNGSMILETEAGQEMELGIKWPDETEWKTFTEYVEALEEPVMTSPELCGMVYETGIKVLEDGLSVEDGTAKIVKQAAIYLAE